MLEQRNDIEAFFTFVRAKTLDQRLDDRLRFGGDQPKEVVRLDSLGQRVPRLLQLGPMLAPLMQPDGQRFAAGHCLQQRAQETAKDRIMDGNRCLLYTSDAADEE